jgi:hypothetical protein
MASRSHVALLGPGQPIELPRPARSAAPYGALALVAATLLFVPDVPRPPAAIAAGAFGLAAAARAACTQHALSQLRATADRLIMRDAAPSWSPLLSWRCGELTSSETRERLASALGRIGRASASSHLPGAVPINRAVVRAHLDDLEALADRLMLPDAVSARRVLLVRGLLEDLSGPLYDRDRQSELGRHLREALQALDDRVGMVAR